MKVLDRDMVETSDRQRQNKESDRSKKFPWTLLNPLIKFWQFSRYYAEYKARSRDD